MIVRLSPFVSISDVKKVKKLRQSYDYVFKKWILDGIISPHEIIPFVVSDKPEFLNVDGYIKYIKNLHGQNNK
jgi:hypothetical protein